MAELEKAVAWLGAQGPAMEALLRRLVVVNSYSGSRAGANAVLDLLVAELDGLELALERIGSRRFGDHLHFATGAGGARVLLLGHTDTVFPPGTFDGYQSDGRIARGPGVLDMKGGLVVLVFALRALAEAGVLGRVPLAGLVVSDEEVGSPESQPIIRERSLGAAAALGLESGRAGDLIVTRRKGIVAVDAVAHGVAAHAGGDHEKGKNAIWALARFIDRAQSLTDYARGITVSVGRFEGGTSRNTVPAGASCEVDVRVVSGADAPEVLERLAAAAREAALPGTRIEVKEGVTRPAMERSEASAALAAEYGECQQASGLGHGEAPLSGGGSDASVTAAAGIPSIDGLGPRGQGFHTLEEQVELASFAPKAEALVRFLARRGARS